MMTKQQRIERAEKEAVRRGYTVAWAHRENQPSRMTVTRPADGHSGELIVGEARAVVGSLFLDDRRLRLDAEGIAFAADDASIC